MILYIYKSGSSVGGSHVILPWGRLILSTYKLSDENEIILNVYADNADIARLIGRKGVMAQAIRQTMTIGSRVLDKKISINFESY